LAAHGFNIKRDQWLREATLAEESGSMVTCKSIIKETMYYGMDEFIEPSTTDEREKRKQIKRVWVENAQSCLEQGAIETARALYSNALS
jgi:pre-mRNA-processing factor 6